MKPGIFGAGSIGCYVGGMLAASGRHPVLGGREAMGERLSREIMLTSHDGAGRNAGPESFDFATEATALAGCDCVFVCVKSGDTAAAGRVLAPLLQQGTTVVSLQNGISNAATLRAAMPLQTVLAGMVGFNVAQIGANRFHRGTEGEIVIEDGKGALQAAAALTASGVPAMVRRDIGAVQWGKLILNLNNAVNALSGLPLKRQLADRRWRKVLAASIREALLVLDAAAIKPARLGKVAPGLVPFLLELPDWLFTRLAASMLKVDEDARSSMAEDLERGREPEIDWLNGEIARLGASSGVPTPVNSEIIAQVSQLFAGKPPRHPTAAEVLAKVAAKQSGGG
ncbi:MAG: 2-dehydropantoate 2-reductase [Nitratireductor sp.]|nr:2-dehydropantoate 2-reductase [Nitratireductor sp.]